MVDGSFLQVADAEQTNAIVNDMVVVNERDSSAGDDDDAHALYAHVENYATGQDNYAFISIDNNGAVDASSFTQRAAGVVDGVENAVLQSNRLVNLIDIDNRGDLTADATYGDGLYAQIDNDGGVENFFQRNNLDIALDNDGNVTLSGSFLQVVDAEQTNAIVNDIVILNEGDSDSADSDGISARIRTDNFYATNEAEISIDNGGVVTVGGDFTQDFGLVQANSIGNELRLDTAGSLTGYANGIRADIENDFDYSIFNVATVEIINDASVDADSFLQIAEITQSNLIGSVLVVNNQGNAAADGNASDYDAIDAEIDNDDIELDNILVHPDGAAIYNSGAIEASAFTQQLGADQLNDVDSFMAIDSSDSASSPDGKGIRAEIFNDDIDLMNQISDVSGADPIAIVNTGPIETAFFVQGFAAAQINSLGSTIEIDNRGDIEADNGDAINDGGDAINARIENGENGDIDLNNSTEVAISNSGEIAKYGSESEPAFVVSQFALTAQLNAIYNEIDIDTGGNMTAEDDAIRAAIFQSYDSGYDTVSRNIANFDLSNTGNVDAIIFAQLAGALQGNLLYNSIGVGNDGGIVTNAENGIDGDIRNQDVYFYNEATINLTNGTVEEAEDVSASIFLQNAGAIQGNLIVNQIAIDNSRDIGGNPTIAIAPQIYNSGINDEGSDDNEATISIVNLSDVNADFGSFTQSVAFSPDALEDVPEGALQDFAGDALEDPAGLIQGNGLINTIVVGNSGGADAFDANDDAYGIYADINNADVEFENLALINLTNNGGVTALDFLQTASVLQGNGIFNGVVIDNRGAFAVDAPDDSASGIEANIINGDEGNILLENDATITILNDGNFTPGENGDGGASSSFTQSAELEQLNVIDNAMSIANDADIDSGDDGIEADINNENITLENFATISVTNSGAVTSDSFLQDVTVDQENQLLSEIGISNSGDIDAAEDGIRAEIDFEINSIRLANDVGITLDWGMPDSDDLSQTGSAEQRNLIESSITIVNRGDIDAGVAGIFARISDPDADLENLEDVPEDITFTESNEISAEVLIVNSGSVTGGNFGVYSRTYVGDPLVVEASTMIVNAGLITAGNLFAIQVRGGAATVMNSGVVLGFADLTNQDDLFVNTGTFEARLETDFREGDDLFTNEEGGVVDTADDASVEEDVRFIGLETFENFGTVSLIDGAEGDLFTIANTLGGTNLNYKAESFLAVDAFLGGPGSRSDIFQIDGNVSDVTKVIVNNTNPGPGVPNDAGITVVRVRGAVDENAFRLANGPIDAGFFSYDLFFEGRDGLGDPFDEFELRSFVGPGAFLLPQLVSAAQDIWHETSDTWFDRSADLRTAFFTSGFIPGAPVPGAMYLHGGSLKDGPVVAVPSGGPAVWARASGAWLEHDDEARTSAFGRSYKFNLDHELHVADFQAGVDVSRRSLVSPGDVLLLSAFGGGVWANLQYDALGRRFDYEGGQAGLAATYLSGGLFVDALFNAQFLEVEANTIGFPEEFSADTYGFRVDSGYRFGVGRFYLEPLLTLAYADSELDGFKLGGNTVDFGDGEGLRGRAGLRAGTSFTLFQTVRTEPYAIASLWSELDDDDNRATLTSAGRKFEFKDGRDDSWTEISFGSHYYLFGKNAVSAFTKTDISFGDDYDGYAFKGGFRVEW